MIREALSIGVVVAASAGVGQEVTTTRVPALDSQAENQSPAPPPLVAIYLGRDGDKLGDLRAGAPDGKPDHHILLQNLQPHWKVVNVHDGPTKWSNQAGNEGRPDEFWLARVYPGDQGEHHLWFSPRNIPQQPSQFNVFFIYADGITVRAKTAYPRP